MALTGTEDEIRAPGVTYSYVQEARSSRRIPTHLKLTHGGNSPCHTAIRIAGFELCATNSCPEYGETMDELVVGTQEYLAPEVAVGFLDEKAQTAYSAIVYMWSAGCIACVLLRGQ